ncbi:MAG TPA: HNH endonuclease [Candidatus Paceibacterota bacterium]|nr:HNH endonuclease [Candidatus Paceibacterota bacterium]
MIYAESDLVIPALKIIERHPEGVPTEYLIKELTDTLKPEGEDAEILSGRTDTKFSQKVRNLKSHDTLEKKNLAIYKDKLFFITDEGRRYLNAGYEEVVEALQEQGFSEEIREQEFKDDYKDIIVEEGFLSTKNVAFRERSRKLIQLARAHFKKGGKIPCIACEFDFLKFYGERGRDYIEIHHTHPIHQHEASGEKMAADEALKKVVPLCSNCHRMVHRQRNNILKISQLKKIIENAKTAH